MAGKGAHLREEDVLAFLSENPLFLESHPELFEALALGPEGVSDKVLNIRERLLRKVIGEKDALERRLKGLMEVARDREGIEEKLKDLERIIFTSKSLPLMLSRVTDELKRFFELDEVCLSLKEGIDESLRGLYEDKGGPIIGIEEKLLEDFLPGEDPLLRGDLERGSFPFFRDSEWLRSEAILPLRLEGELFGSLNLASRSPERFHPDLGVHLLKRFALHLSMGIAILRERECMRRTAAFDEETTAIHPQRLGEVLGSEFYRADRYGNPLSLLLFQFKGEAEASLPDSARLLKKTTRGSDILIRGTNANLVLLLPMTPLDGAAKASHRFSSLLSEEVIKPEALEEAKLLLSLSALPESGAKSWEELLAEAKRFLPGGPG